MWGCWCVTPARQAGNAGILIECEHEQCFMFTQGFLDIDDAVTNIFPTANVTADTLLGIPCLQMGSTGQVERVVTGGTITATYPCGCDGQQRHSALGIALERVDRRLPRRRRRRAVDADAAAALGPFQAGGLDGVQHRGVVRKHQQLGAWDRECDVSLGFSLQKFSC